MSEGLTGTETKQALECCTFRRDCLKCPSYIGKGPEGCVDRVKKGALDLINRYEEEIERYKGVIKILEKDVAEAKVEGYKEFAEQLKTSAKGLPYEGWLYYITGIMLKERAGEDNG